MPKKMTKIPGLMLLLFFLSTMPMLHSCKNDEGISIEDQKKLDQEAIELYLKSNSLTSVKLPSGLHHIIVQEGVGPHPLLQSNVQVLYKGTLLNGQIFDQTAENQPISFELQEVILGWQEGIQLMKKDGKSILIIPSYMGYGNRNLSGIPANSVLVFDVELLSFN